MWGYLHFVRFAPSGLLKELYYNKNCSLLPIAYCLLPVAYCLLPIACCLLPVAYCLLPIAYCLLPYSVGSALNPCPMISALSMMFTKAEGSMWWRLFFSFTRSARSRET